MPKRKLPNENLLAGAVTRRNEAMLCRTEAGRPPETRQVAALAEMGQRCPTHRGAGA